MAANRTDNVSAFSVLMFWWAKETRGMSRPGPVAVNLATWKVEMGGSLFEGSSGKKASKTPSQQKT
jgi:hypothetical protein